MDDISTCAKCGNNTFKMVLQEPTGSKFKLNFIQCSSCNTPVGVIDIDNIANQLQEQRLQLHNLNTNLAKIKSALEQMTHALHRR